MNSRIGVALVIYAGLLILTALLVHLFAPDFSRVTWLTALLGGGLCILWGGLAIRGHTRRVGPVLTLIPITYILLGQTVNFWSGGAHAGNTAPAVLTLTVVMSGAMLAWVLHAGKHVATPETAGSVKGPAPAIVPQEQRVNNSQPATKNRESQRIAFGRKQPKKRFAPNYQSRA